jgi:hypothetical protein
LLAQGVVFATVATLDVPLEQGLLQLGATVQGSTPEATLWDTNSKVVLEWLPRGMFLVALIAWASRAVHHGLLLSPALSVCFIGLMAVLLGRIASGSRLAEAMSDVDVYAETQVETVLSHLSLYIPLLLTLPAFLVLMHSRARWTPMIWTSLAATLALVAAVPLWLAGLQGMPQHDADFPNAFAQNVREYSVTSLGLLAFWLAAFWVHRR